MTLTELQHANLADEYDDHMRLKRQRNTYYKQVKVLTAKLKDQAYHHDEQVSALWARIDQLERQINTL
jgi:hypothetical protein